MDRKPPQTLLGCRGHDINRYMRFVTLLAAAGVLALFAGCDDTELEGAAAEVKKQGAKLDLPTPPAFDMPAQGNPHNVREMRLMGRNLLDTDVEVKGYVVWIYNCLEHGGKQGPIGEAGATPEEKQALIDADPTLCWISHFIMGDSADTSPGKGLWVVEVPRAPRKDEMKRIKRMTKEQRDAMPKPPEIAVGDEVIVTGGWKLRSDAGFANSYGLLQYQSLRREGDPLPGEEAPAP